NQYANVHVYERLYKQEETRWVLEPLKYWGQAYQKNLVVKINQSYEGVIFDSYEPYSYDEELGFVYLPGVFTKWSPKGNEERLQYKTTEDKSVIITYIKPLVEN
ncbi:MAG: CRISPR-associated helicase Cas3', partial [Microcystaceae cyanobacterium]